MYYVFEQFIRYTYTYEPIQMLMLLDVAVCFVHAHTILLKNYSLRIRSIKTYSNLLKMWRNEEEKMEKDTLWKSEIDR